MEKHIEFPRLDDTRRLHSVIRRIPDDWRRISGYLISPEVPLTAMSTSLNGLLVEDRGISLHRKDRLPELFEIFVCKKNVDKVVFETFRPPSAVEIRSLVAGLVELGYCGPISFSLESAEGVVCMASFEIKTPASLKAYCSCPRGSGPNDGFEQLLRACERV